MVIVQERRVRVNGRHEKGDQVQERVARQINHEKTQQYGGEFRHAVLPLTDSVNEIKEQDQIGEPVDAAELDCAVEILLQFP